jgi:hypothetical protein
MQCYGRRSGSAQTCGEREAELTRQRVLGIVWMIAGLVFGLLAIPMIGLAQDVMGIGAGVVVLVLALLALVLGILLLLTDPIRRLRRASLALSVLWIVGSIFTTLSFDFAVDRLVAGGLPATIGALTAVLAWPASSTARTSERPNTGGLAEPK